MGYLKKAKFLEACTTTKHFSGSRELHKTEYKEQRKKWKTSLATNRYAFIKNFYDYVLDPNGYGKIKWSEWLKHKR